MLYAIRKLRTSGVNSKTPIIVADTYQAKEDRFYGNVEQKCLQAGATKYIPLVQRRVSGADLLIGEIEKIFSTQLQL